MFDPTTASLYIAAGTPVARAQAVADSLGSGTLTAKIYDTGVEVYSGTFTGPLTVGTNGELVISARPTGSASGAGTPAAATWKVRISSADGRWVEGSLGPTGRFQLSDALSIGRLVTLNGSIDPQGGVATFPVGNYTLGPLGSRVLFSNVAEIARLRASIAAPTTRATQFRTQVEGIVAGGTALNYGFKPWMAALWGKLVDNVAARQWAVNKLDACIAEMEAIAATGTRPTTPLAAGYGRGIGWDSYLDFNMWMMNFALVYDWCRDELTPAQKARWLAWGDLCCNNLWNYTNERWGGVLQSPNTWARNNPGDNYYHSFLEGTIYWALATDGESTGAWTGQTWIEYFRETKWQGQVLPYQAAFVHGGGSLEGIGYGITVATRLYHGILWWYMSTGENLALNNSYAYECLDLMTHGIVPSLTNEALAGDSSSPENVLDINNRTYYLVLSNLHRGTAAAGVGKTLMAASPVAVVKNGYGPDYSRVHEFLWGEADTSTPVALNTLPTARLAQGIGYFYGRDDWTTTASWFLLVCGPFEQNHAHQDQGAFQIWKNQRLATAAEAFNNNGTVGTFSYSLGPSMHNQVRVEQSGVHILQTRSTVPTGSVGLGTYRAASNSQYYCYALADNLGNYDMRPQITRMEREFLLIRPGCYVVFDRVATTGTNISRIWTLNLKVLPTISGSHLYMVSGADRLDAYRIAPTGLTTSYDYWPTLGGSVYTSGYRISAAHSTGDSNVFLHVIGLNNVVASAVASDATGQTGVLITFADGGTATVRFSTAGTGGTIDLRDSGNSVLVAESFTTTVDL